MGHDRAQGLGYTASAIHTLLSSAASPFADGYVIQKRGSLRIFSLCLAGFPVAGVPPIMTISDGPAGQVLWRQPLYGVGPTNIIVPMPVELDLGIYVAGVSLVAGTMMVTGSFVMETRTPTPSDIGASPR
jgi:hypothetical protein